ncbi:MAG: ATP-binding protein [Dehalococcoidia bacterium]|nr:ATP-binding protein [Dehalococcoidia bacterium]
MKQLREILSKARTAATSEALGAAPPGEAEDDQLTDCTVCGGAGFIRRQRPLNDPRFGKAEPCDCVLDEGIETRKSRLERIGNLEALRRYTFATLSAERDGGTDPVVQRAIATVRAYAENPAGWLVITGPSGTGKTHLAAALAHARVDAGHPALFLTVPDLLDHLRSGYQPEDEELTYDRVFEQVRNAPLLLLDDVDAASPTPWAREKLFQLLNARYNESMPTVFTTSVPLERLEERLATRLGDSRVATQIDLSAPSGPVYTQVGGMTRDRLAEMRLDTFDLRGSGLQQDERESLATVAHQSATSFASSPEGWLIFEGPNGCGKTHLAAGIANRVLEHGQDVCFAVVPDLLDELRQSYRRAADASPDIYATARNATLLILDDFGAQVHSPWEQEKLYQLVNSRSVSRMATIVTMDRPLEELEESYARIYARIANPSLSTRMTIRAPHYFLGRRSNTGSSQRSGPSRRR